MGTGLSVGSGGMNMHVGAAELACQGIRPPHHQEPAEDSLLGGLCPSDMGTIKFRKLFPREGLCVLAIHQPRTS